MEGDRPGQEVEQMIDRVNTKEVADTQRGLFLCNKRKMMNFCAISIWEPLCDRHQLNSFIFFRVRPLLVEIELVL